MPGIGGIAENRFIHQVRADGVGQIQDHILARNRHDGFNRGETGPGLGPQRRFDILVVGVLSVTHEQAHSVGDVLIHPYAILTKIGGQARSLNVAINTVIG